MKAGSLQKKFAVTVLTTDRMERKFTVVAIDADDAWHKARAKHPGALVRAILEQAIA